MRTPARRKKKGVSNAKEVDRIRSISTRSVWNKPATTSPPTYAGSTASLPAAVARAPSPRRTASRNLTSGSLTRWPKVLITNRMVTGRSATTVTLTATKTISRGPKFAKKPPRGNHRREVSNLQSASTASSGHANRNG